MADRFLPVSHFLMGQHLFSSLLYNNSFGQNEYVVLQYLNHATVYGERLLSGTALHHNWPLPQRTDKRCVVVQDLKLALTTGKRDRAGLARKDLPVWSNDVYIHKYEL